MLPPACAVTRWVMFWSWLVVAGLAGETALSAEPAAAGASASHVTSFELTDQYDQRHRFSVPLDHVTLLTVADKKGSDQVDSWVAAVKADYAGRIDFAGVADLSKVPGVFRGLVLKKFKKQHHYPVMLDWEGSTTRKLGCAQDQANVFLVNSQGRILLHLTGDPTPPALQQLRAAIDQSLGRQSSNHSG